MYTYGKSVCMRGVANSYNAGIEIIWYHQVFDNTFKIKQSNMTNIIESYACYCLRGIETQIYKSKFSLQIIQINWRHVTYRTETFISIDQGNSDEHQKERNVSIKVKYYKLNHS